jgi:hypothetical protein
MAVRPAEVSARTADIPPQGDEPAERSHRHDAAARLDRESIHAQEPAMQTRTPETMSQPIDRNDATTGRTDGGGGSSPVDNATYNILMALTSKLEAIDVYAKYAKDGDGDLWTRLSADERRDVEDLLTQLKQRLVGS